MTRRQWLALALPPTAVLALAVLPPMGNGRTLCPIAFFTGVACPGCGMTRALSHLLHGDLTAAVAMHPLVIPTLAVIAVAWIWLLLGSLGRTGHPSTRLVNSALVAGGVVLVGVWVVRLSMDTLPPV